MTELSHTLEVDLNESNVLWRTFIRIFVKFYDLSRPYDLNTCKLFWGGVGLIVLPIILLALSPLIAVIVGLTLVGDRINDRFRQSASERRAAYRALSEEERYAIDNKKSRRSGWLDKLSTWGSIVWFKVSTPITWFFRFAIGAAVLVALAILVIWAVGVVPGLPWGAMLNVAWKAVLALLVAGLVGFGIGSLFMKWWSNRPEKPKKDRKPSVLKAIFNSIHDHTCANVRVVDKSELASD